MRRRLELLGDVQLSGDVCKIIIDARSCRDVLVELLLLLYDMSDRVRLEFGPKKFVFLYLAAGDQAHLDVSKRSVALPEGELDQTIRLMLEYVSDAPPQYDHVDIELASGDLVRQPLTSASTPTVHSGPRWRSSIPQGTS